jgi:hypothetical protein
MKNSKFFIILTLLTLYLTASHPSIGCFTAGLNLSNSNQRSPDIKVHTPFIEIFSECPASTLIGNLGDMSKKSTLPIFNNFASISVIEQSLDFVEVINSKDTSANTLCSNKYGAPNLGLIRQFLASIFRV